MASAKKSPLSTKVIIIAVVVLLLVGIGAYLLMGNKTSEQGVVNTGSNAITSIKDALSKSVSLQCEYTDSMGRVSKVSIKNGAMRGEFSGQTEDESGNMIVRDKKMYFWNDTTGFVMEIPEGEEWDTDSAGQGGDFMKEIEQYKDNCKPAVVSDSIFTVPSDVTFQDFSKMMQPSQAGNDVTEEDVKKMMEQYQQQ